MEAYKGGTPPVGKPPGATESADLMQVTGGGPKVKVLLVDDDEDLRKITGLSLTTKGYDVVQAVDGDEGLQKFIEDPGINVVVTDLTMPKMHGDEMADHIKEHAGESGRKVGILLCTGLGTEEDLRQLEKNPNIDIARMKPLRVSTLEACIDSLIQKQTQ